MTWRTTFTLIGAFVATLLIWLIWRPGVGDRARPAMLFPWKSDEYTKIEIQPPGKPEIILEQRAGELSKVSWFITKPIARPAWLPYVAEMLGGLRGLKSDGVIEPGKPGHDPALAGVDRPELTVRLNVAGEKKTVKFGRLLVKDPAQRWFVIENDPNLYFGPTVAFDAFSRSVGEIRHRGVIFFEPPVVRIEISERYERPVIDPKGQRTVEEGYDVSECEVRQDAAGNYGWYWVRTNDRKVEERLDEQRVAQFLGDLDRLMAEDFTEAAEPAKYGLDRPGTKYRLWLRNRSEPVGIRIGKTDKVGAKTVTYVQDEGSTDVAIVEEQRLAAIPLKFDAFRSTMVYDFPRSEVRWVDVANDLGRIRLVRTEETKDDRKEERWTVEEPAGLATREEALRAFVEALSTVRVKEFLGRQPDLKLFGLDPPGITVTILLHRGEGKDESLVYRFGCSPNDRKESRDTYLMKPGTDEVFSTAEGVYQRLDLLDLNVRDVTMFSVRRDSIVEISGDIEDEDEAGKRHYFWIEKKADGQWVFRDTVNKGEVDPAKLLGVLMLSNYICADAFISRRPEVRKEYGLEGNTSAGRLEVVYEDEKSKERRKAVLRISRPFPVRGVAEKARYGMLEGDPTIFRLPAALAKTLTEGVLKPADEKPK